MTRFNRANTSGQPVYKHIGRLKYLMGISTIIFLFAGCSEITSEFGGRNISEGRINYKVSFPNIAHSNLIQSLLPNKIKMVFKNGECSTEIESIGGMFKTQWIANEKDKRVDHLLKLFKKQIRATLNAGDIARLKSQLPDITIVKTKEVDSVAGYLCHKAICVYTDPKIPNMNLYYTDQIKLKSPNWYNQYSGIDGVLLKYEIEEFGLRLKLEAQEVIPMKVTPAAFIPDSSYNKISPEALQVVMQTMLNNFNI